MLIVNNSSTSTRSNSKLPLPKVMVFFNLKEVVSKEGICHAELDSAYLLVVIRVFRFPVKPGMTVLRQPLVDWQLPVLFYILVEDE